MQFSKWPQSSGNHHYDRKWSKRPNKRFRLDFNSNPSNCIWIDRISWVDFKNIDSRHVWPLIWPPGWPEVVKIDQITILYLKSITTSRVVYQSIGFGEEFKNIFSHHVRPFIRPPDWSEVVKIDQMTMYSLSTMYSLLLNDSV